MAYSDQAKRVQVHVYDHTQLGHKALRGIPATLLRAEEADAVETITYLAYPRTYFLESMAVLALIYHLRKNAQVPSAAIADRAKHGVATAQQLKAQDIYLGNKRRRFPHNTARTFACISNLLYGNGDCLPFFNGISC